MKLNYCQTSEEAAATAGKTLNNLLNENKNLPILLMLSGGSALNILDYISASSLSNKFTISVLDERFCQDAGINNFLQLQKQNFYQQALSMEVNFIGTLPRNNENMEDMRVRWELALTNWMQNNPTGKILAIFGMGADGHTAGIFPYTENPVFFENQFENHHLVTAYEATGKHKYSSRLTTTFPFFKKIDSAILYACGKEKKAVLEKLVKGTAQPHELPALGIYKAKNLEIFTDIKL